MKKKVKFLAIALAALIAVACLSACSLKNFLGPAQTDNSSGTPEPASEPTAKPSGDSFKGFEVTVLDLTITVPEGFKESPQSADNVKVYVPGDWPAHSDNISISFVNQADNPANYTSASLRQLIENSLQTEVTGYKFSKDKVDGADRVTASYNVVVNGISMDQEMIVYLIGKKSTVSVTFTSVSGEFDDEFASSKASIKIG